MTNDRVFSANIVFYPILPNISQILTKKDFMSAKMRLNEHKTKQ